MSDRVTILNRVREALREPAAPRHLHGHGPRGREEEKSSGFQAWMPSVGSTWPEWFSVFQRNLEALKGELVTYTDAADLRDRLADQARRENWKKIATHRGNWIPPILDALSVPQIIVKGADTIRDIESCDAGITECDALVAQTGSALITSLSAGGRVLSVLPRHHVILARRDQLVPDLEAAFQVLRDRYSNDWPSFISFITGPSRTGDIERILVLGAHGPKRLTIYCGAAEDT